MRASKARTGRSTGYAWHRRWLAYGAQSPWIPEVGTVCGKAARTDLCGGRPVMGVPTATAASSSRFSAAWPLAARAQQPAMPVIGFLRSAPLADATHLVTAFRQGLKDTGFVEGQNVAVEYSSAENHLDRLQIGR